MSKPSNPVSNDGAPGRLPAPGARNPFPGPQPYRAADRRRFFGRDALVKKLTHQILARPSTTLYGPSGAGKSSLMQAGVIPRLLDTHDFRVVRATRPRGSGPSGEARPSSCAATKPPSSRPRGAPTASAS